MAVPRAGISCPAGPGPNPKVRGLYHLEPTLTDNEQLHEKSRPEAEPGGPCDVSTSAPVNTSTCAATNASVYALADDPDDRRERPQPGSAEGPGQPRELQQGPPMSRGRPNKGPADGYPLPKPQERPHPGLAEGPEQPEKLPQKPPSPRERPHPRCAEGPKQPMLQQRPSSPREWPHQVGLADVIFDLTDIPTSAKMMSCHFYSCGFGLGPPVACQGDSEPSLGRVHWWSNRANNAKATGLFPLLATKKKHD